MKDCNRETLRKTEVEDRLEWSEVADQKTLWFANSKKIFLKFCLVGLSGGGGISRRIIYLLRSLVLNLTTSHLLNTFWYFDQPRCGW